MVKCAICKQEIDESGVLSNFVSGVGYVHSGECSNHLQEMAFTESQDDTLNETELLM